MQAEPTKPTRLLRLPEVLSRIPYKRTRFFELVREGRLPKPVRLPGGRAVCWPESVIDDLVARIASGQEMPK